MAQEIRFTYPSADRITDIQAMMWIPDGKIRGILQISHGMLEFVERYGEFARFLNRHGILTVGTTTWATEDPCAQKLTMDTSRRKTGIRFCCPICGSCSG